MSCQVSLDAAAVSQLLDSVLVCVSCFQLMEVEACGWAGVGWGAACCALPLVCLRLVLPNSLHLLLSMDFCVNGKSTVRL